MQSNELLKAVLARDQAAWRTLVAQHEPALCSQRDQPTAQ